MKNLYAMACSKPILAVYFLWLLTCNVSAQELMRANLYVVDGNGVTLVDGNLTNYNSIYSNNVDINDAWKMFNPGINFGILRESANLVVERRSIYTTADTTFFRMWNMFPANYRIKLMLNNLNHPDRVAFLKDNFLNTTIPINLNDTTDVDFSITGNPASASEMRFQLIYGMSIINTPVPVNITGIVAQRQGKVIAIDWSVVNETSMKSYVIEYSADGRSYASLAEVTALNLTMAKKYYYNDLKPSSGNNFYRIKGISYGGNVQYSDVAKVASIGVIDEIVIYPNPVTNLKAQLRFINQALGKYTISLIYSNGIRENLSPIQLSQMNSKEVVFLPEGIAPGIYKLRISGPANDVHVITIRIQ